MQIQLKQREIEEGVKGFLVKQGINLTGKVVTVGFTAGRSDRGLTAEIDIEDTLETIQTAPINRYSHFPELAPTHPLHPSQLPPGIAYAANAASPMLAQSEPAVATDGEGPGDPEPEPVKAEVPAKSAVSLFS